MNILLVIIYYIAVAFGILIYVLMRQKGLSISDFIMVAITVLFNLSGVIIAYGIPYGTVSLDTTLYIMYLLFALIVPIGLLFGQRYGIKTVTNYYQRVSDRLLNCYIALVGLYAIGYFLVIRNSIPLIMLLTGKSAQAVKVARLQVTLNITNYFHLPSFLRFYGLIFDYVSLYVFAVLLVKYLNDKRKYRVKFWIYAVFEFFLMFYATEKAPLIYLLIIVVFCIYFVYKTKNKGNESFSTVNSINSDRKAKRKIRFFAIGGAVAFLLLYTFFMGIENYNDSLRSIVSRAFVSQSSSVYLQKQILDSQYGGCLNGAGIPLTIIDSLIGRNTVNLSKEIHSTLFKHYTALGGGGTAGSIAIFEMYANFGLIIAVIIVAIVSIVTGVIDKKTTMTIQQAENSEIPIALKAIIAVVFFRGFLGHFQTFLSFPFIISIPVLIILFMTWTFRHVH